MNPHIDILDVPPRYQAYFDWLITGLGILEQQGRLTLAIHQTALQRGLRFRVLGRSPWPRFAQRPYDQLSPLDYWCLTGRVRARDRVMTFVVDPSDSPFTFSLALLEAADLYFKSQCPGRFEPSGFALASRVRIPYHPDVFTFANKIRPGMLGRPLARSLALKPNLRVLQSWEADHESRRRTRIFASFGSDEAPKPATPESALPAPHNYENEPNLLRRWGGAVHHPNRKRGSIVRMLRSLNKPDIQACLFHSSDPELVGPKLSEPEYRLALQEAGVNVNICGFRRSIPCRFMDTLLSGAMIATDTLAIEWHAPFERGLELVEIGDLGYEPEESVNWPEVKRRFLHIYEEQQKCGDNAKAIREAYRRKWAPTAFASHVVQQCLQTIEGQP